jgi:hypothetical protein
MKPLWTGLGLAVVAHIIGQLRGQLRVDSKPGVGSQFVFLIPFDLPKSRSARSSNSSSRALSFSSVGGSRGSKSQDEIESLIEALDGSPLGTTSLSPADRWGSQSDPRTDPASAKAAARVRSDRRPVSEGEVELEDTNFPLGSLHVDPVDVEPVASSSFPKKSSPPVKVTERTSKEIARKQRKTAPPPSFASDKPYFKVLIVEVCSLDSCGSLGLLVPRIRRTTSSIETFSRSALKWMGMKSLHLSMGKRLWTSSKKTALLTVFLWFAAWLGDVKPFTNTLLLGKCRTFKCQFLTGMVRPSKSAE